MTRALLALAAALALSGCGSDRDKPTPSVEAMPPLAAVTITDPMAYLATQSVNDPITERRFDYGHYQATDAFRLDDKRAVVTWDYPQFGSYAAAEGDGGEQYVVEGDTVRIEGTRDGGKPYNQHFVGKDCGGTGWVLFRTDAPRNGWRELVARLGIAETSAACSVGSSALTQYGLWTVDFPVIGQREVIVSEHYNRATIARATAMERSFLSGGRIAWQAFATHPPLVGDLAQRCPDFGWHQPPAGMQLVDCRISVHPESASGTFAGTDMWRLGK